MNENNQDVPNIEDYLAGFDDAPAAAVNPPPAAEPAVDSPPSPPALPQVDPQRGADFLRDQAFAVFMSAAIDKDLSARLPITAFDAYHGQLLQDLGNPTDPILKMIAQQLVVAHFQFLRLQVRIGHAKSADECGLLGTTACHLMAEFRRSAVTLHEMRNSAATAAAPTQSSAQLVGSSGTAEGVAPKQQEIPEKTASRTEQGSNVTQEPVDERTAATQSPSKNPRRVAAGRLNRLERRGLTDTGRQRLREAALRNRPWLKSTGPTSIAGRARSAANGRYRQAGETSKRLLRREMRTVLGQVRSLKRLRTVVGKTSQSPERAGQLTVTSPSVP